MEGPFRSCQRRGMSLDWSSPKAVHPLAGDVAAASSSLSTRSIRSRKSSVDPQTLPSAEHPRPGLSRFDAATSLLAFESNGKARTSFDGLTRAGTEDEAEREVVVHQVRSAPLVEALAHVPPAEQDGHHRLCRPAVRHHSECRVWDPGRLD